MAYLTTTPRLLRALQPAGLVWSGLTTPEQPVVYLSFDDGPHPDVTPQVLALLDQYDAAATFFCVGENAARYPALFQRLLDSRHAVGNHTHRHRNGWKTDTSSYLADAREAARAIPGRLFRPPYGRITRPQARGLQAAGYTVVMWDVLAGDFDARLSAEQCVATVVQHARPGSIIVLHDSVKAAPRMLPALPHLLDHFQSNGWALRRLAPPTP